jgi:hypothetical protein
VLTKEDVMLCFGDPNMALYNAPPPTFAERLEQVCVAAAAAAVAASH